MKGTGVDYEYARLTDDTFDTIRGDVEHFIMDTLEGSIVSIDEIRENAQRLYMPGADNWVASISHGRKSWVQIGRHGGEAATYGMDHRGSHKSYPG